MPLGAGDIDAAGLQRLAKRFECRAVELRQLVEKKNALMGKRNFSWTCARSAADESRQRGRMMRVAEWPLAGQLTAAQSARDRLDHAELERLTGFERRQNSRKPRC